MPYKITCAGRCIAAHALCPAGRGPALSLVLGVAGCNSRAGLRSIPALADRATTSSAPRRRARGCDAPHKPARAPHTCMRPTHLITSAHVHAHTPCHSHTDCDLRVLAWRPGRVQQGPFSHAPFWRGLYFPVQSAAAHTAQSSLCTRSRSMLRALKFTCTGSGHEMGNLGTHHMGMESAK